MSKKEDLGLKVGTKLEVLWTDVKERAETSVENLEKELIVQKAILQLCHDKIKNENPKYVG